MEKLTNHVIQSHTTTQPTSCRSSYTYYQTCWTFIRVYNRLLFQDLMEAAFFNSSKRTVSLKKWKWRARVQQIILSAAAAGRSAALITFHAKPVLPVAARFISTSTTKIINYVPCHFESGTTTSGKFLSSATEGGISRGSQPKPHLSVPIHLPSCHRCGQVLPHLRGQQERQASQPLFCF